MKSYQSIRKENEVVDKSVVLVTDSGDTYNVIRFDTSNSNSSIPSSSSYSSSTSKNPIIIYPYNVSVEQSSSSISINNSSATPLSNPTVSSLTYSIPPQSQSDEGRQFSPEELFQFPITWHLASCFILTAAGGMYLAGTFKVFGAMIFDDEYFLASVAEYCGIFNFLGRIFWGYVGDRIGHINALLIASSIFALIIGTYSNIALYFGQTGFALWSFGFFFCEGANFALYLPLTMQIFGQKYASANYGVIFPLYSLCTVIVIIALSTNSSSQSHSLSFSSITTILSITLLFGIINVYLLKHHIIKWNSSQYSKL